MNKQQLLEHLQDIEWDNFEVKKAEKELPKSTWETVSAFANTSGGWLVLGVSQQGKKFEITGVEDMEKLEQNLGNTLRSRSKFNTIINPSFLQKIQYRREKSVGMFYSFVRGQTCIFQQFSQYVHPHRQQRPTRKRI
jgi:ATP-dependent DNA helicase RecG